MIFEIKKGDIRVGEKVKVADTMIGRMIGLMFSDSLGEYDGLLIQPCNSIHTFFMKYDLDIVFLNKDNEIVSLVREMKPWRMTRIYFKAVKVLEMKGGTFPDSVGVGDKLELLCLS